MNIYHNQETEKCLFRFFRFSVFLCFYLQPIKGSPNSHYGWLVKYLACQLNISYIPHSNFQLRLCDDTTVKLIPPFTGAHLFHGSTRITDRVCPCWSFNEAGVPPPPPPPPSYYSRWTCVRLCEAVPVLLLMLYMAWTPLRALISPLSLPSPLGRIVKVRSCDFCYDKRRSMASGAGAASVGVFTRRKSNRLSLV